MNVKTTAALTALLLGLALAQKALAQDAAAQAQADKSGGLFPNDFGSPEIDVSSYPKEQREAYKLMQFKCAACHTVARPINSQYLELTEAEEKKARAEEPGLFKDDKVIKIGSGPDGSTDRRIWARFVKRMMAKPGCPVKPEDGKKIYEFLVYDAKIRKMGASGHEFREQRAKLVHEFQEHHKDAYEKIFGGDKTTQAGK